MSSQGLFSTLRSHHITLLPYYYTKTGFYAAASKKLVNVNQVRIFTFAAPRVGGISFRDAYQHLERAGRIRHARFSVTHDLVPLVPFCNLNSLNFLNWKYYKHVGMQVQLHGVGWYGKWRLKRNLDVTYPLHHWDLSEIRRMVTNSILLNLNTLGGFKRNHTITEQQRRLRFASQYRVALAQSSKCTTIIMHCGLCKFILKSSPSHVCVLCQT